MSYKVKVLRSTAHSDSPCSDGIKCPLVAEVEGRDELSVIYRVESDSMILFLFGDRLGSGEALGTMPRGMLSAESPAVVEVEGKEELYLIVAVETDPGVTAAFADRIGPGEALGRVPRAVLVGVS